MKVPERKGQRLSARGRAEGTMGDKARSATGEKGGRPRHRLGRKSQHRHARIYRNAGLSSKATKTGQGHRERPTTHRVCHTVHPWSPSRPPPSFNPLVGKTLPLVGKGLFRCRSWL